MKEEIKELLSLITIAYTIGICLWFLFALFLKLLWNWLMPMIFSLPEITYWQAWGLGVLTSLLFGKINVKND